MIAILLAYTLVSTYTSATELNQNDSEHWAILVACSSGYRNYRHQANVAHAYNVLVSNGMDPSKIITFSVDDIAYNNLNPFKGEIFHDYSHTNYYSGVNLDYTGEEVSGKNFLSVLLGDKQSSVGNEKVLHSGPNDNIFIFISGLGSNGHIAFSNDRVFAQELNSTLGFLSTKQKFAKMVIYLDSPYATSMLEDILRNTKNIYALASTGTRELNAPMFCDDQNITVCLADNFSYGWITDSTKYGVKDRTLMDQFRNVSVSTSTTVKQFGDLRMSKLALSEFQAGSKNYNLQEQHLYPYTAEDKQ